MSVCFILLSAILCVCISRGQLSSFSEITNDTQVLFGKRLYDCKWDDLHNRLLENNLLRAWNVTTHKPKNCANQTLPAINIILVLRFVTSCQNKIYKKSNKDTRNTLHRCAWTLMCAHFFKRSFQYFREQFAVIEFSPVTGFLFIFCRWPNIPTASKNGASNDPPPQPSGH